MRGRSKKKRTERATGAQIQALVDGVVEDTTLHTEKFTGPTGSGPGKVKLREKWEALARRLNQLGPTKHWTQWKQVCLSIKIEIKVLIKVGYVLYNASNAASIEMNIAAELLREVSTTDLTPSQGRTRREGAVRLVLQSSDVGRYVACKKNK